MSYSDEPKEWNNKCPECNSFIKWSLNSSRVGAKSPVICSKNIACSRLDIVSIRDMKICMWEGYVVRQKDGGVRFSHKNGEYLRER